MFNMSREPKPIPKEVFIYARYCHNMGFRYTCVQILESSERTKSRQFYTEEVLDGLASGRFVIEGAQYIIPQGEKWPTKRTS